jgi:hypothetical protein
MNLQRRIHKQTSVNCNSLVKQYKKYILKCKVIYEIIFALLRTLDCLGLRHANRLKTRAACFKLIIALQAGAATLTTEGH